MHNKLEWKVKDDQAYKDAWNMRRLVSYACRRAKDDKVGFRVGSLVFRVQGFGFIRDARVAALFAYILGVMQKGAGLPDEDWPEEEEEEDKVQDEECDDDNEAPWHETEEEEAMVHDDGDDDCVIVAESKAAARTVEQRQQLDDLLKEIGDFTGVHTCTYHL